MKEAFDLIRKEVRVLSEQEFCKRRKQEECDKYVDCGTCLIDSVIQIVSEVEAEYGNGWIPCSERLPEESLNSVIGWDEYRERCVFVQYLKGQWKLGNWESVKIVAWMPVPEPYKPEEGAQDGKGMR